MILKLRSPNSAFPQNGWPFKDPKTGFVCNGFEGTPEMHAVKIIANRRANPQHYPKDDARAFDTLNVIQEIYAQKAVTHPEIFNNYQGNLHVPVVNNTPAVVSGKQCKFCNGTDVEGIQCRTCGGNKITGYKCRSCGKSWDK